MVKILYAILRLYGVMFNVMQTKNKIFVEAHAQVKKGPNRIMCNVHGQEHDFTLIQ